MVNIKSIVHNQMVQIQLRYTCFFGTQLKFPLLVYKEDVNPHSLVQSQKSGWIGQRVVASQLTQKIFSITLLATYGLVFWSDLWCISDLCLSNLVKFWAWVYQLKQFDCTSCPRQTDLPLFIFLLYHCWNKTPLKGGGYTKATNTIYKSVTIGISFLREKILRISISRCRSSRNAWAQA